MHLKLDLTSESPGELAKHRLLSPPPPRVSDSVGLDEGPGDAAPGLGTTL